MLRCIRKVFVTDRTEVLQAAEAIVANVPSGSPAGNACLEMMLLQNMHGLSPADPLVDHVARWASMSDRKRN